MPQQRVNIGPSANTGTGDSPRVAFGKLNANDADLDARISAASQGIDTKLDKTGDASQAKVTLQGAAAQTLAAAIAPTRSLGITRADIPNRMISVNSFRVSGFSAAGDYGAGAYYISGGSTGPMAIQDVLGSWFQLDLSGPRVDAGWFGVIPNIATSAQATANSAALTAATNALTSGQTLLIPLGSIAHVGWTIGDGTNTSVATKCAISVRSKGGRGGVSAGLFGPPRFGTSLLYMGPQNSPAVTIRGPIHSSDLLIGVLVDGGDLASVGVDAIHPYGCNFGFQAIRCRSKSLFLRCIDGPLFSGLTQGCMDNRFYNFEGISHTLNTACAVHVRGGEANNVGCSRNHFYGGRFEIGGAPNWGAIVLEFADNNRFLDIFTHDGGNANTGGKGIWYVPCTTNPIFPCDNFFSGAIIHGDGGTPGTQGNVYYAYATSDGEPLPIGGTFISASGLIGNVRRIYSDGTNSVSQPAFTSTASQGSGLYFPGGGSVGLAVNGAIGVQVDTSGRLGVGTAPVVGYGITVPGDISLAGGSHTVSAAGPFIQIQGQSTVYLTTAGAQQVTADANGIYPATTNRNCGLSTSPWLGVFSASGTFSATVKVGTYTVATLPTPGVSGRIAKATNGRALGTGGTLEASGAGTGCLVEDSGSAWRIVGTNITVSA